MADMALYVEKQGDTIDAIEKTTENVMKDAEKGYEYPSFSSTRLVVDLRLSRLDETTGAKKLAQRIREKKKLCFLIFVIILLIIAIIIGVYVSMVTPRYGDTPLRMSTNAKLFP
jgi:t-SNARE complex subunit (syntaxin)